MRTRTGRTVIGVLAGYLTNAVLVVLTEAIYPRVMDMHQYFVADLITQVAATVAGGSLCCLIARQDQLLAATVLAVLGMIIGGASLVTSWNEEPHWYAIALLVVYPPCVSIGYALMKRRRA